MLSNCGAGEDFWESLEQQGDLTSPWIFIERTDAEAEAPVLSPSDAKTWLIRKHPDAGKDWRQEKWMTEDEMVGFHHWFTDMSLSKLQKIVNDREDWCTAIDGVAKSSTWPNNWSTTVTYHEGWFLISSLIELYPGSHLSQGLLFNQIFLLKFILKNKLTFDEIKKI